MSRDPILHSMELRQNNVDYRSDGERMSNDVSVGDNIVFLCNNNGDKEFRLLLVDQFVHFLEANVVDGWDQEFLEGESIIRGFYYKCLQSGNQTYWLLDYMPLAYVYLHLLVEKKFQMPPTAYNVRGRRVTYQLLPEFVVIISTGISF